MLSKANDTQVNTVYAEEVGDAASDRQHGNAADRADMYRMGKTQELKRGFRFVSIFSFCTIVMCTWEVQFP
jgi:choline transport protein